MKRRKLNWDAIGAGLIGGGCLGAACGFGWTSAIAGGVVGIVCGYFCEATTQGV